MENKGVDKKLTVSTTLSPEDLVSLERVRRKTGMKSISAVIREAVKLYLATHAVPT